MKSHTLFSRAAAIGLLVSALPTWSADDTISVQDAITDQLQDFQKYDYDNREEQRFYEPGSPLNTPEASSGEGDKRCLRATSIRIENSTLIPPSKQAEWQQQIAKAPCFSLGLLSEILSEISKFYISEGYITSQALQPYQDADGVIVIPVVEGTIDSLKLNEEDDTLPSTLVYPNAKDDVFNMRDLEQALDQINRLRTYDYTSDLKPGSSYGASSIVLRPTQRNADHHYFGSVGYSKYSRLGNINATVGYDNPLNLFDTFSVSVSREEPNKSRRSRSLSLNYSVPYGYSTFSLSQYWSRSRSNIELNVGRSAVYEFDSYRSGLGLSTLHFRDQTQTLSSFFDINFTDNSAEFSGIQFETSTERITSLDLGLDYVLRGKGYFVTSSFGLDMGLPDTFGTRERDGGLPDATYRKLHFSGTYFAALGGQFRWRSQLVGQYSDDRLPGFKKISIGGYYSVRGFKQYAYSGNSGAFLRNDLIYAMPSFFEGMSPSQLTLSIDGGSIASDSKGSEGTELVGANIGYRSGYEDLVFQLDVGKSLYNSRNEDPKENFFLSGNVSLLF